MRPSHRSPAYSNSNHVHAPECLKLTGHLWYADGATAGSVAPFGKRSDLNEVVLSRRDLQLHTCLIGFQNCSPAMPVLTIHNLVESMDPVVNTSFLRCHSLKLYHYELSADKCKTFFRHIKLMFKIKIKSKSQKWEKCVQSNF